MGESWGGDECDEHFVFKTISNSECVL